MLSAEEIAHLRGRIEHFLQRLFRDEEFAVFDVSDQPAGKIDALIREEAMRAATAQFIQEIRDQWKTAHPELPPLRLHLSSAATDNPPATAGVEEGSAAPDPVQPAVLNNEAALAPGEIPVNAPPALTPEAPPIGFDLPNGKVGVPYSALLVPREGTEGAVSIHSVDLPEELGLQFDPETAILSGTPRTDGEFPLRVRWTQAQATVSEGSLVIIPDPRSLWRVVEPPADAPYPKPHLDSRFLEARGVRLAAASRRGRSHAHAGSFREDDFFLRQEVENDWSILVVCDGAGSAEFSREGSRLVAGTVGQFLEEQLTGEFGREMNTALHRWEDEPDTVQKLLGSGFQARFLEAARRALDGVGAEAARQGAPARDYATTLLVAVARRIEQTTFLASLWIGDGAIAAYGPRGKVRLMGSPDTGSFAGQTLFLAPELLEDPSFSQRIAIGRYEDLTALLLMTDGVSDPHFETPQALSVAAEWDALWDRLQPSLHETDPARGLLEWLNFFTPGYHDDRTLALLW